MSTLSAARLQALAATLQREGIDYRSLSPMADTGLAHDHVWIHRQREDWVARLPKQSQMNLPPQANLDYQAACYARASQGGHTPCLHHVLPATPELPRGRCWSMRFTGVWQNCPEIYRPSPMPLPACTANPCHARPLGHRYWPLPTPGKPW